MSHVQTFSVEFCSFKTTLKSNKTAQKFGTVERWRKKVPLLGQYWNYKIEFGCCVVL